MGKALIIGCGGVAGVVIHKCCQNSDVFEEIMIASRTKSKCDAIKEQLEGRTPTKIRTAKVDADNVDELCALIDEYKPDIVMNIALPYQERRTTPWEKPLSSAAAAWPAWSSTNAARTATFLRKS